MDGSRGWFGIGLEGVSKPGNAGAVFRTAHAFGAAFLFTVGESPGLAATRIADTSDSTRHLPFYRWASADAMALPERARLVGVELVEGAIPLPSFRHPLQAAYVFGPERASLSRQMLARCDFVVRIPTRFAINLAVAAAIVMYDRLLVHGRFPERPVAAGGPAGPAERHSHGRPRFRRGVPALLRESEEGSA